MAQQGLPALGPQAQEQPKHGFPALGPQAQEQPKHGFPALGPQVITPNDIMNDIFFLTDEQWKVESQHGQFDYVIIGSSFCALAFVEQAVKNNPNAKIMIIERGTYYHPDHFQNLPPPFVMTVGSTGETFPWTITNDTNEGQFKWQHGMNNFFGGRSVFWCGWCPEPTDEEMSEWPKETKENVHKYFDKAKKLLNVIPADQISKKEQGRNNIYGVLQSDVQMRLKDISSKIATVTRCMPAPLAVSAQMYRQIDFSKYAVVGPLLSKIILSKLMKEPLKDQRIMVVINCVVKMINHNGSKAAFLETSKGNFKLGNAKLILAMGTLPPTTLMLNSFSKVDFPLMKNIGERFTAHFISSIVARVPAKSFSNFENFGSLEMSATYIAGKEQKSTHQFHIQLSVIYDNTPIDNIFDTLRHLPDVVTASSIKQLTTSKDYVIFVCAVLGELDHKNDLNWFRKNKDHDVTSNATLQMVGNSNDNIVWDAMEDSTFQTLEILAPIATDLEYWHSNLDGHWEKKRPTTEMIRVPGTVHEASTMWFGKDEESPVDLEYRFKGVENVYLTGASLWPTGGSWNPTCVMAGLSMHLADILCPRK